MTLFDIILTIVGGLLGGLCCYLRFRIGAKEYCRHWGLDFKEYWENLKKSKYF